MNKTVIIGYYFTLILFDLLYIHFRDRRLSISDLVVILTNVAYSGAGVFISYGIVSGYLDLDRSLLMQYLSFHILTIMGVTLGKRIKIGKNIANADESGSKYVSHVSDRLVFVLVLFVALYFAGFLYIIRDSVPLFLLIKGADTVDIKIARLRTTHNLTSYYNLPYVYRFHGLVFDLISYYIFGVVLAKYLFNPSKYRILFFFYCVIEFMICFYATEKAAIIYLIMIVVIEFYFIKLRPNYKKNQEQAIDLRTMRRNKKKIRRTVILGTVGLFILYMIFMGIGDMWGGLLSILSRTFVSQSSSVYLQKRVLDQSYGGCLNGAGLPLTIIDSLIGRTPINLSAETYSVLFSWYLNEVGNGTTGTMPGFFLYSNLGLILSSVIVLQIGLITGYVDSRLTCRIYNSNNKELSVALYSIVALIFIQGYLGTFSTIVSIPFFVSPHLFIVIITTLIFEKIK